MGNNLHKNLSWTYTLRTRGRFIDRYFWQQSKTEIASRNSKMDTKVSWKGKDFPLSIKMKGEFEILILTLFPIKLPKNLHWEKRRIIQRTLKPWDEWKIKIVLVETLCYPLRTRSASFFESLRRIGLIILFGKNEKFLPSRRAGHWLRESPSTAQRTRCQLRRIDLIFKFAPQGTNRYRRN